MNAIEGRAICDERVADCRCHKTAGHVDEGDPIHACDPNRCTGSWTGQDPDFEPVTFPRRVGEPRPWEFA